MGTPQADSGLLTGRRALICRPQPDAGRLSEAFIAAGADTRILPMLTREPIEDDPAIRTQILSIDEFQHVIVVSPYAARLLIEWLDTWWPQTPVGIHWYGVGSGTTAVLESYGLPTEHPTHGFDSEALLELPSLQQLHSQKALIVRGDSGRELLPETLASRGASVTRLALYRRARPVYDEDTLRRCLVEFDPDVVVTLSGETLNNLILLGERQDHALRESLLVVPVERIAKLAREAGFRRTCIPESLSDHAIVEAVAHAQDSAGQDSGNTQ